jgi:WD40 repeat protein/serine/threonine protein kinase
MSDNSERERQVFGEALELGSLEEQRAFVKGACGGDEALRQTVEGLLEAYSQAGGFIPPRLSDPRDVPCDSTPRDGPGTIIGRYKLLEKIGEGGMGVVYMAEQQEPVRRKVALKVIKLGMDSKQVIARFEAERQALALMDHPNIAKVLDGGVIGAADSQPSTPNSQLFLGRPYFVMELVQGVPITEFCDKNHLPIAERIKLFIPVCQAIQSAHQKGIIHRDLKPTNILVTLNAGVPHPMVIDFGVAKAINQKLTEKTVFTNFAAMIGTPAYMSPEQAEMSQLDVDTRSDIYGLGVLLYELLTGTTPFPEKRLRSVGYREMQRIIMEEQPERPSTRLRQKSVEASTSSLATSHYPLSTDLDWIVMKCLEKDRARRYETANGLAADLKRHLDSEPVAARPPSTAYRVQKFVRRNRVMATAVSAVAAVVVLGTFVSTWQAIRATQAKHEQSLLRQQAETNERKAQIAQANEAQQRQRAETQAYVANMNLAQQAWEQNNVERLRMLLDQTAAYPARGFEWYYWQRQAHLELNTLRGHTAVVSAVAFAPDGSRIVTGSYDRTAKVWQAATGRELLTLSGHTSYIRTVAFSPDGLRIATGSDDKTAKVWDAASGKELFTLDRHSNLVYAVAFSPGGRQIATAGADGTARIWDTATGKELFTFHGHTDEVACVTFFPDGLRVATASRDGVVKIWEAASGKESLTFRTDRPLGWMGRLAASPDGKRLVTAGGDNPVAVWDAAIGKKLLECDDRYPWCVAFSPDGRRIVSGGYNRIAKVWDAVSGTQLLTLKGHRGDMVSVAFSPDGKQILTGSSDGTAKVWAASPDREVLTLRGHTNQITVSVFTPDGRQIVTASCDGTARVWDANNGREVFRVRAKGEAIWSMAISPDGKRVVTDNEDGTATVWDAANGKELLSLSGHSSYIRGLAFSPDGRRIATASADRTAKVFDAATGKLQVTFQGHLASVLSVAFSPDGQRIVTGSSDHTAKVWDSASGNELFTLSGHKSLIQSVAYSPDGHKILTGSTDGTAKVWDADNGREVLTLRGHASAISGAAFSPDGTRIVTGSLDQTAKIWNAGVGDELLSLNSQGLAVWPVAFSPDGGRVVTGCYDGTTKVWAAATALEIAAWQQEDKADAERLAVLIGPGWNVGMLREEQHVSRAHDPARIRQWLVLAPIPLEEQSDAAALRALDQEQIPQEAYLHPRAGDRIKLGQGELKWGEVRQYLIDFNQLLGQQTEWSVAYAVCYLQSGADRTGLRMEVGSDDQAKIYLNGKEIYRNVPAREFVPDQDVVEGVELKTGLNVLVFKVVNETEAWKGSVRLTDAYGQEVKGASVTLTPP